MSKETIMADRFSIGNRERMNATESPREVERICRECQWFKGKDSFGGGECENPRQRTTTAGAPRTHGSSTCGYWEE